MDKEEFLNKVGTPINPNLAAFLEREGSSFSVALVENGQIFVAVTFSDAEKIKEEYEVKKWFSLGIREIFPFMPESLKKTLAVARK
jgi:hypothetical protein